VTVTSAYLGAWQAAPGGRFKVIPRHGWLTRLEWLDRVGSTNDLVLSWLHDGEWEVCVGLADEQAAGRGRSGRSWSAPPGAAVLCSIGFRPTWLDPAAEWRLAAIVSLAMAEAAEASTGLPAGTIRLKWPNDLVIVDPATGTVRKLAGVLGETEGVGTSHPLAVIGIGLNAGWARGDFPPDLASGMTSLGELTWGGPIDREALVDAFLRRLGDAVERLRAGEFPAETWGDRQLTNGLPVRLEWPDGSIETVIAVGVDAATGALLVRDRDGSEPIRRVLVGEIQHLRLGSKV
jgi:BirA family biotin operon repressor/biotin-[acetyl-CoA-carboxylase] ligase